MIHETQKQTKSSIFLQTQMWSHDVCRGSFIWFLLMIYKRLCWGTETSCWMKPAASHDLLLPWKRQQKKNNRPADTHLHWGIRTSIWASFPITWSSMWWCLWVVFNTQPCRNPFCCDAVCVYWRFCPEISIRSAF